MNSEGKWKVKVEEQLLIGFLNQNLPGSSLYRPDPIFWGKILLNGNFIIRVLIEAFFG